MTIQVPKFLCWVLQIAGPFYAVEVKKLDKLSFKTTREKINKKKKVCLLIKLISNLQTTLVPRSFQFFFFLSVSLFSRNFYSQTLPWALYVWCQKQPQGKRIKQDSPSFFFFSFTKNEISVENQKKTRKRSPGQLLCYASVCEKYF